MIDVECKPVEPGFAYEICRRQSRFYASRDQIPHLALSASTDPLRIHLRAGLLGKPQRMEHERGGFVEGIVGPVTEENACAAQPARAALYECADRDRCSGPRAPSGTTAPME